MQFWNNLNPREKLLVGWVMPAVAILLFYLYLWQPTWQQLHQLRLGVPEKTATLEWMKYRLADAPVAGSSSNKKQAGPLLTEIEKLAIATRIKDQIQRVQPSNDDSVEIWYQEVQADALFGWIDRLAGSGIAIQSATITRTTPGLVAARVKVSRLQATDQ